MLGVARDDLRSFGRSLLQLANAGLVRLLSKV